MGGWVSGGLVGEAARDVVNVVAPNPVVAGVVGAVVGAAVSVVVVSSPLRTTTVATPTPSTPTMRTASAIPRSRLSSSPWWSEVGPYPPIDYAASTATIWGPSAR